ncbi:GNAT family N-acetyltransferase [Actinomyces lilanjuaniae]|nr:GNAT family N-acetyltransferase [Actinomyces lilanjuaniae]
MRSVKASGARVVPYDPVMRDQLLDLSIRAWAPVFEAMSGDIATGVVPRFVYDSFWPQGWEARQRSDLAQVLDQEAQACDVALVGGEPAGWVCTRIHPEDSMGEVYILCVDPAYQRQGVGRTLMERAHSRAREAGMHMVMVETGGDAGHASARAAYEAVGYTRWPVARYFKEL